MHESVLHLWKPTSLALTASAAGAMFTASLAGPVQPPALPNPAPAIRQVATVVDQGLGRIGGLKGEASDAVAGIQSEAQDLVNQSSADVAQTAGQVQGQLDAAKSQISGTVAQAETTLNDTAAGAGDQLSAVKGSVLGTVGQGEDTAKDALAGIQGQLTDVEEQATSTLSSTVPSPQQLTGTVGQLLTAVPVPLPKFEADADVHGQGAAPPSYNTRLEISSR